MSAGAGERPCHCGTTPHHNDCEDERCATCGAYPEEGCDMAAHRACPLCFADPAAGEFCWCPSEAMARAGEAMAAAAAE
jgi:hypothetical protein